MTERILIADDSLSIREAAQSALAARGARLEAVADGREALAKLRDAAPQLLIADVHMPGGDGYALCREAKSEQPGLRVLLVVGTFEPFDAASATAARADGVLRKPFMPDELLRKVEELLGPVPAETPPRGASAVRAAAPPAAAAVRTSEPAHGHEDVPAPGLSDAEVDRIARRVLAIGGEAVLERVARELLGGAAVAKVPRSAEARRGLDGEPEDD
ncbi:MAG TPA: response regulator [Thermoanaerobaculia bacterium]|nr:response regulator [Thermoanaerobaculia bacterium]